jgi:(4S)-4-hydroxy-5-phosphonooxypentane-2,3-dione isomerase
LQHEEFYVRSERAVKWELPWSGSGCFLWVGSHDAAMLVVLVHVKVLEESIEGFKAATVANAASSRREAGIARFDVIQQVDDRSKFVLVEVYRTGEAAAAHKETEHYKTWRDTVAGMMAEPRVGVKYASVDPGEQGW